MKVQPARRAVLPGAAFLARVEAELAHFLGGQRERLAALAPEALPLLEELEALIRAGGKRLRPLFCYWGHRAVGGEDVPALARAGAAVELVHTSAIVHDDVLDRATLRRGRAASYRRLGGEGQGAERFGRAAAILAGDLAQAMADELLATSGFPPERLIDAFAPFTAMRVEAIGGEMLDLEAARRREESEDAVRRAAALKSGSYTVVGPLLVGAALAGADRGGRQALERYGRLLGEAFQLRDDVLGTFGDPAVTGKDGDADIREGKQTTLIAAARRMGSAATRRLLAERLGRQGLSEAELREVREAIRDSGALAHTIALVDSLAARAKAELAGAELDPEAIRALGQLADLVALREV